MASALVSLTCTFRFYGDMPERRFKWQKKLSYHRGSFKTCFELAPCWI